MKKPIAILVTGSPISGKTSLANKLERALSQHGKVINHDVDFTENWKDHYPGQDEDFYLLQTPHGGEAESEDGISFRNFNLISYVYPKDMSTKKELLVSRGEAWFREGVIEHPSKGIPTPNNPELIYPILKRILTYSEIIEKTPRKDLVKFRNSGIKLEFVHPYFQGEKLLFKGYEKLVKEILQKDA